MSLRLVLGQSLVDPESVICFWVTGKLARPVNSVGMSPLLHFLCHKMISAGRGNNVCDATIMFCKSTYTGVAEAIWEKKENTCMKYEDILLPCPGA